MMRFLVLAALVLSLSAPAQADLRSSLKVGTPDIQSAGPLAFGPEGILFIGDTQQAAIFAIGTADSAGAAGKAKIEVQGINDKAAAMLGVTGRDILINDMAVNPASGNVFLSVSRGRGPDATPVLLKVDGSGKLTQIELSGIPFAKATLPNAPAPGGEGRQNRRAQSITDIAFVDGQLFVAGLSNEEFASNLRSIPFPFKEASRGTSVEIYHGAHGAFETRSPVRTFVAYKIGNETNLLAAYTCTPLVKFPVSALKEGQKVQGTTIAELGNRNSPLDMVVYEKDGKNYILIANTSRGIMKVTTDGISQVEAITEKVAGTKGLTYETISDWKGVAQLDKLNDTSAVVLLVDDAGTANLQTVALP